MASTGCTRLALVGCEAEGRQMITNPKRIADAGGVISAVCDSDPKLAAEAARVADTAEVYHDVREMIAAGICDGVLNFEASVGREAITEAALTAGLHVYSDKPFAFGLDRAQHLATLATENDVELLTAPAITLWPSWKVVRKLIAAGEIGRPVGLRAHFDTDPWPWQGWQGDPEWYFQTQMGPLRDLGPYPLHLAMDLFGPATTVSCTSGRLIPRRRIIDGVRNGQEFELDNDDVFALSLGFAGGEYAFIQASYCVHASRRHKCEIFGEFGAIGFDPPRANAPLVVRRVADYDAAPVVSELGPDEITERSPGGRLGLDLIAGVEEFLAVIAARRPSPLGVERSLHVIDVLDRAYESLDLAQAAQTKRSM